MRFIVPANHVSELNTFIVASFAAARRQFGLQFVQGLRFWCELNLCCDAGRPTIRCQGPLRPAAQRWE